MFFYRLAQTEESDHPEVHYGTINARNKMVCLQLVRGYIYSDQNRVLPIDPCQGKTLVLTQTATKNATEFHLTTSKKFSFSKHYEGIKPGQKVPKFKAITTFNSLANLINKTDIKDFFI